MAKEVINPKPCIQIELYFLAVCKNTRRHILSTWESKQITEKSDLSSSFL